MQHNTTEHDDALHPPLTWKQLAGLATVTIAAPIVIIIAVEGMLS